MPAEFLDTERRSFKPTSTPGLSNEAREAVNAALQALATWRNEIADATDRNSKQVIKKMATAAVTLGWPPQIVEAARAQMLGTTDMQIKTMGHVIDAWEEQLKLPSAMTASPSALLSKLRAFPGSTGVWPSTGAIQKGEMNPLLFWTQMAEQWQKSWSDTMTYWGKIGKLN